ncbi:MAG: putative toxin-antitoxin system toxin component, PIN family [Pyrinomonadaceae bacterium]
MRATFDTNTVVSGTLWFGPPHQLLKAAEEDIIKLFTTSGLIAELEEVLNRPKFKSRLDTANKTVQQIIDEFSEVAEMIVAAEIAPVVIRDPDDDAVIACAVASESDVIVSGDKDLLDLGSHKEIRILRAAELLKELEL